MKGATDASYKLGGGVTDFPLLTRVNVSTLSKYASFNDENSEALIPIDVAVEADRRAKSPVIVGAMARKLGYRLVVDDERQPEARPIDESDMMDLMSEFADVIKVVQEAKQTGTLGTAAVTKRITKEVHELIRELKELMVNAPQRPDR
nr:phage regulatory CII family protein [Agrobacterium tumefaciens]